MSQTVNKQYQDVLTPGQVTRSGGQSDTAVSEDSGAITVENLLIKGAAKNGALLPVAAFVFADVYGIVVRDTTKAQTFRDGGVEYAENDSMAVMRKGYMAVTLSQAVLKDDKLFFVHTAGASAVHTWRKDLDTANASAAPVIALEAGAIGDVIEVLVNLDMQIGIS